MTGAEARLRFLDWLARERRASANTIEAYGRDLRDLLQFLSGHLGGEADAEALAGLRAADLRAFLARRAADGAGVSTRARQLAAVRGFRVEGQPFWCNTVAESRDVLYDGMYCNATNTNPLYYGHK